MSQPPCPAALARRRFGHPALAAASLLLAVVAAVACDPAESPVEGELVSGAGSAAVGPIDLRGAALERDDEALDESLRQALADLRDKFRCNGISGCPAADVLVGHGWEARPYLESIFAGAGRQAPYRARTVGILADLQDPSAEPFFRSILRDFDPQVRAHALVGLALLDARRHQRRFEAIAAGRPTIWQAPARLAALWGLHRWGDPAAATNYLGILTELSGQHMGGAALTWGLELCARPGGPDCASVLPAAARHPAFTARREAIRRMTEHPRPAYAATLVHAVDDPVRSISGAAESALQRLSGRFDLRGGAAWRRWCEETKCGEVTGTAATR